MPKDTLRGRRILIAEDEYFIADELSTELVEAGAEMMGPVASVKSGLQLLATETVPDAASLDVNLGGENVYPLADALIARGVPFVFMTGYDQASIPASYAHIRCVEKPAGPETVLMELEKLLRI
ncbi:response regulator [uncultured Enterovirga sp.]|uniref:response regulator n=1 Tax=uncultured Enterovirga sp. TaxID=2026352 RepID=UPI0035CAB97B